MLDLFRLVNRHIITPLYYWKNRDARLTQWKSLEKQQFWPKDKLENLQLEKLKNIVAYAYEHTDYYRAVMDERGVKPQDIRNLKDIEKLPILTKAIIQKEGDALLSKEFKKAELIKDASGGSTGEPTNYYKDLNRHNIRRADQLRHDSWSGWRLGERSALIWGAQRDLKGVRSVKEYIISRFIARQWELDAFEMSPTTMDGFIKELTKIRPTMVLGYANALYSFAQYKIETQPDLRLNIKGVISSAETLTEEKRTVIEAAFGCPVLNRYGSREVGLIASECKERSGLHINADNLLVEIVGGEKQLDVGERGDIVVTDFWNKGMPFIRYKLEDVGYLANQQCKCGRSLPLLGAVEGRLGDFFVAQDQTLVHGEYFTHLLYGVEEVSKFQFIQHGLKQLEIKLVLRDKTSSIDFVQGIKEKCLEILGDAVQIEVNCVESIPTPPSGKSIFTISKVKPEFARKVA